MRESEEILETIRPYFLTNIIKYLLGLAFILASAFFMFWLLAQGWWGNIGFGLGIFLGIFIIFKTWFIAHNNLLVITNERLADVSRLAWFEEVISSVRLSDVKDILVIKKGILPNIFNYGKLVVMTKNENVMLQTLSIYSPQRWQAVALEIIDDHCEKRKLGNKKNIYKNFKSLISEMSEDELVEIKSLIDDRLGEYADEKDSVEDVVEETTSESEIEIEDITDDEEEIL